MQPSPLDALPAVDQNPESDFAPLLVEPPVTPVDPPLGSAGSDPLLGPSRHVSAAAAVPDRAPVGAPVGAPVAETPAAQPPAAQAPAGETAAAQAPAGTRPALAEPDVIWGTGRSTEQVLALVREARRDHPHRPAVVLRASADALVALAAEHDAYTTVSHAAMAAAVGPLPEQIGRVVVVAAGGADTAVAAEAAFVATVAGTEARRLDDVGASRLRPLLEDPAVLGEADCVIVVAGPDASLAGLVGAMTDAPVVAVPTSNGQPGGLGGLAALITMLNSASPGVSVSNIDNGFSAGVFAARVARRNGNR